MAGSAFGKPGGWYSTRILYLEATNFDNPNTSDWAVNALAPAISDPSNDGASVRAFDDTSEEGVGFTLEIPPNVTNVIFDLKFRAQTSPGSAKGISIRAYFRAFADAASTGSWSSAKAFSDLSVSDDKWYYDTQEFALSTWGLTAGTAYQFEFTRNGASGTDTLSGDWLLFLMTVRFS